MSKRISGTADRVYVPDAHGEQGYRPFGELVSMVRVFEKGPDVQLEIMIRGIRAGHVLAPRTDEAELRRRLFADVPAGVTETLGTLVQELEDLAAAHNVEGTRMKRREILSFVGQLRLALPARSDSSAAVAQGDGAHA